MTPTTRRGKDCLPRGYTIDDLKLAKWFLGIVAPLYPGTLHSHSVMISVPDKQGRRKPTSLSALFHEQWPDVQLSDILMSLACAGFITLLQRIKEPAANTEAGGYSFRLVSRDESAKHRPGLKGLEGGRQRQRKVG
jgi:hypothetical protein